VAERVLDVLAEDRKEEHVAEEVLPAAVHEHGRQRADRPGQGRMAGVVHVARVEGRLRDRPSEVGELVDDPDGKIRRDQRDVHDRKAACGQSVREREHRASSARVE
jgi:hypothetical protein